MAKRWNFFSLTVLLISMRTFLPWWLGKRQTWPRVLARDFINPASRGSRGWHVLAEIIRHGLLEVPSVIPGKQETRNGSTRHRSIILFKCQGRDREMPSFCGSVKMSSAFNSPTFKGRVCGIAPPLLKVETASKKNSAVSFSVCMDVSISTNIEKNCILSPGGNCHCGSGAQTPGYLSGFTEPCYGLAMRNSQPTDD